MKRCVLSIGCTLSIASITIPLTGCAPPGYHYAPGSFTPTKNADDGLQWCKPEFSYRVPAAQCDAAIAAEMNSPAWQAQQKQQMHCMNEGAVYSAAASYRDQGLSPKMALYSMRYFENEDMTENFLKHAINNVYFDARFVNAGGHALAQQIAEICLYPNGRFSPLQ